MLFRFTVIFFLAGVVHATAQRNSYARVIKGDSTVLFLSSSFNITDSTCASYKRYVRINENGEFNSSFVDVDLENNTIGAGKYVHGKKEGPFEIRHRNGKVACRGSYVDNKRSGTWEFFRENGVPERTLNFAGGEGLVIRQVNEDGDVIVNNGNGEFEGALYENYDSHLRRALDGKGQIVQGRRHGKWKALSVDGRLEHKEEFENGRFLNGKMAATNGSMSEKYTNRSRLHDFDIPTYLYSVEQLIYVRCDQLEAFEGTGEKYEFDWNKFSINLKDKIRTVVANDVQTGRYQRDYMIGDNYFTVRFATNEEGKAVGFQQTTPWGSQFFHPITSTIRLQTKFRPNIKAIYFHFKFSYKDGLLYTINFQFSEQQMQNFR